MAVKVYRINEIDCVATEDSLEETIDWYEKEHDLEIIKEEVEEINLEKEGVWVEMTLEECQEYEEKGYSTECPFYFDGVELSYKELLENNDFEYPCIISTTNI